MGKVKSAIEHLESGRQPHIVHMIPPGAPGYREAAGGAMVVSSPAEVDALLRSVARGEVLTLDDMRSALARRHQVATACPVSTAIFANMCARAAEERRMMGGDPAELTPWWRLLKRDGFLNPKVPGGMAYQAELLQADGVRASPRAKHLAVYDFADRTPRDPIELR